MKENKKQWKTFKSIKINNKAHEKLRNFSWQRAKTMVDNFDLIMAADPDTFEALKIFNEYSNKNKND